MVISSVPGTVLVQNAHWCRDRGARIEGPDQALQLRQLAGIHAHWTATTEASSLDETGPRVGAVAVESHAANVHLTCEAPLFRAGQAIVPIEALALQRHEVENEQPAIALPPVTGGPSMVPLAQVSAPLKALAGSSAPAVAVAPAVEADISVTAPGHAAAGQATLAGSVMVTRRSMEHRRSENMSRAAVTPQAFSGMVSGALIRPYNAPEDAEPGRLGPAATIEEVVEEV